MRKSIFYISASLLIFMLILSVAAGIINFQYLIYYDTTVTSFMTKTEALLLMIFISFVFIVVLISIILLFIKKWPLIKKQGNILNRHNIV